MKKKIIIALSSVAFVAVMGMNFNVLVGGQSEDVSLSGLMVAQKAEAEGLHGYVSCALWGDGSYNVVAYCSVGCPWTNSTYASGECKY